MFVSSPVAVLPLSSSSFSSDCFIKAVASGMVTLVGQILQFWNLSQALKQIYRFNPYFRGFYEQESQILLGRAVPVPPDRSADLRACPGPNEQCHGGASAGARLHQCDGTGDGERGRTSQRGAQPDSDERGGPLLRHQPAANSKHIAGGGRAVQPDFVARAGDGGGFAGTTSFARGTRQFAIPD